MAVSNKNSLFLSDQALVSALNRQILQFSENFQCSENTFLSHCQLQGITSILDMLSEYGAIELPDAFKRCVKRAASDYLALHLRRKRAYQTLHDALLKEGIEPILLKGAAVSMSLFDREDLRMRGDTDILVSPDERERATAVLAQEGYRKTLSTESNLVFCEQQYGLAIGDDLHIAVDLHWAVSNRQVFAHCLPYASIVSESRQIKGFKCLSPVHAMLHSVIHRLGHHPSEDRLIWQLDHYLIWKSLSSDEQRQCAELAAATGLACLLRDELQHVCDWSGLTLDPDIRSLLDDAVNSVHQVDYHATGFRALKQDLSVLSTGKKLRYLLDLCFPSKAYMKTRYAFSNSLLLPWYYLKRIWSGVRNSSRAPVQTINHQNTV